ncbi:MAG: hypothetical protein AAF799_48545, partial [Myxococcota bacterium]
MEALSLTNSAPLRRLAPIVATALALACGSEPTIDDTSNPDGFPLPPDTSGTTSASTSDAETSTSNDSGPDPDGTSSDSSDGGNS